MQRRNLIMLERFSVASRDGRCLWLWYIEKLEVRASGGKTYYQRYTDERGRERQFKVGPADVLTLRQARRKALQIKAEAILGNNPQEERQAAKSNSDVTVRSSTTTIFLSSRHTKEAGKRTRRFCASTSFPS